MAAVTIIFNLYFFLHKNWHPSCLDSPPLLLLSLYQIYLTSTLIDSSTDKPSIHVSASLCPCCHFWSHPSYLPSIDLLPLNPKLSPLGRWLPHPLPRILGCHPSLPSHQAIDFQPHSTFQKYVEVSYSSVNLSSILSHGLCLFLLVLLYFPFGWSGE